MERQTPVAITEGYGRVLGAAAGNIWLRASSPFFASIFHISVIEWF